MHVKVNMASFNREMIRLDRLLREISQNSYVAAKDSAEDYNRLVRTGIAVKSAPSFAPAWKPLSDVTIAKKTAHKDEFWAETLGIYKAIKTKILSKTILFINIFAGISSSDDPDAFERAKKNEYGFGLGPARPLFEPAKDAVAPMTGAGRRLLNKSKFIYAVKRAIRKVYK